MHFVVSNEDQYLQDVGGWPRRGVEVVEASIQEVYSTPIDDDLGDVGLVLQWETNKQVVVHYAKISLERRPVPITVGVRSPTRHADSLDVGQETEFAGIHGARQIQDSTFT